LNQLEDPTLKTGLRRRKIVIATVSAAASPHIMTQQFFTSKSNKNHSRRL
jgi:hypothetical protein